VFQAGGQYPLCILLAWDKTHTNKGERPLGLRRPFDVWGKGRENQPWARTWGRDICHRCHGIAELIRPSPIARHGTVPVWLAGRGEGVIPPLPSRYPPGVPLNRGFDPLRGKRGRGRLRGDLSPPLSLTTFPPHADLRSWGPLPTKIPQKVGGQAGLGPRVTLGGPGRKRGRLRGGVVPSKGPSPPPNPAGSLSGPPPASMGTVGVVYISLLGVKSYDQRKIDKSEGIPQGCLQ